MTPDQLELLMGRLRGTWPGEWDHERCAAWIEELDAYPYAVAVTAIRTMARECEFPSIAAFTRFATGRSAEHPEGTVRVAEDGSMHVPGTGWLPAPSRRALPERTGAGPTRVVVQLEEARRRLEEARRRKTTPHEEDL